MIKTLLNSLQHSLYPHFCLHCESIYIDTHQLLCATCLHNFPHTKTANVANNNIEQLFWGRIPVAHAFALGYFTQGGMLQKLVHKLKYKNNVDAGKLLGKLMSDAILNSPFYKKVDAVVALPLHPLKFAKRGYNQAEIIAESIAQNCGIGHYKSEVQRQVNTSTQTAKSREQRFENMRNVFILKNTDQLKNKHILLIDDILTTGATLEACGLKLLEAEGLTLYIAAAAFSTQ